MAQSVGVVMLVLVTAGAAIIGGTDSGRPLEFAVGLAVVLVEAVWLALWCQSRALTMFALSFFVVSLIFGVLTFGWA